MDLRDYSGIFVPVITPMNADGVFDSVSMNRLVSHLLGSGSSGIWLLGTTGEFSGLSPKERDRAVAMTLEFTAKRMPVITNVSDASTTMAVRHAKYAISVGATAVAATVPYYYPHSMAEALRHFEALRSAVGDTPLFIYQIPSTVKVRLDHATILQLAQSGTTDGIKDSQDDLGFFRTMVTQIDRAGLFDRFRMFAGTNGLIDLAALCGAHGAIPSLANVVPELCAQTFMAAMNGDVPRARVMQRSLIGIWEASQRLGSGSSNAKVISAVKHVLAERGLITDFALSRPLVGLTPSEAAQFSLSLDGLGDIVAAEGRGIRPVSVSTVNP